MSTVTINGRAESLPGDHDTLLVDAIRDHLNLTGTKLVCGSGVCGACTVLLDGEPVVSCLLPASAAAGKSVTTIEGIGGTKLHPIQRAFMAHDALQCGFCTPGFVVEATAFHDRWRSSRGTGVPTREEIAAALSGHLCRCGAYEGIYRAVAEACAGRFDDHDAIVGKSFGDESVTASDWLGAVENEETKIGVADHLCCRVIEPAAEGRTRLVNSWGIDEHHLMVLAM